LRQLTLRALYARHYSEELGWLQIQGNRKQTIHMNLGGGNLGDILGENFGDQVGPGRYASHVVQRVSNPRFLSWS